MKLRNTIIALVFSAFAASTLAAGGMEGQTAPDFALKSSTGENLRLSEYRGDVVMINFWATWCGPCRAVAPILDELAQEYAGRIKVVKVDTDANGSLAASYGITSIPTMMFFAGGEVLSSVVGAKPKPALIELFDEAIEAASARA